MAVRFSPSSPLIFQNFIPIKKHVNKVFMVTYSQIPLKKTSPPQIFSSSRNKIFEDHSRGIVCYRDDSGEITCEGYDEGPRPTLSYHPRDADIIDLLQKSWLQIAKGSDLKGDDAGGKDFNFNGFNTFC